FKMPVHYLRQIDRTIRYRIQHHVEDKIFQAIAAPLIKFQSLQRRPAIQRVPNELRTAVLQKRFISVFPKAAAFSARMLLLPKAAVRTFPQQLIIGADDIRSRFPGRLQQQRKRTGQEFIVIIAEGDVLPRCSFDPPVPRRTDPGIFLGQAPDQAMPYPPAASIPRFRAAHVPPCVCVRTRTRRACSDNAWQRTAGASVAPSSTTSSSMSGTSCAKPDSTAAGSGAAALSIGITILI